MNPNSNQSDIIYDPRIHQNIHEVPSSSGSYSFPIEPTRTIPFGEPTLRSEFLLKFS